MPARSLHDGVFLNGVPRLPFRFFLLEQCFVFHPPSLNTVLSRPMTFASLLLHRKSLSDQALTPLLILPYHFGINLQYSQNIYHIHYLPKCIVNRTSSP